MLEAEACWTKLRFEVPRRILLKALVTALRISTASRGGMAPPQPMGTADNRPPEHDEDLKEWTAWQDSSAVSRDRLRVLGTGFERGSAAPAGTPQHPECV
jgi:hypothetical protein